MLKKISFRTIIIVLIALVALAIGRNTVDPMSNYAMTVCGAFFVFGLLSIVYDLQ